MAASVWSSPLAVYVFATIAVALALVEVALPTFGAAGITAFVMAFLALWGIDARHHEWWPFVFIGFAFALWVVELVRGSHSLRWVAAGSFGSGSLAFGLLSSDAGTVVVAVAATAGLIVGFPKLAAAMGRLRTAASPLGMSSMPGRSAVVDRWDTGRGTVLIDGSRWSATGPPQLAEGETVTVSGYDRMTLEVTRGAPGPSGASTEPPLHPPTLPPPHPPFDPTEHQ